MVLFEDTGVPLPEVNIEVLPEPTEKIDGTAISGTRI